MVRFQPEKHEQLSNDSMVKLGEQHCLCWNYLKFIFRPTVRNADNRLEQRCFILLRPILSVAQKRRFYDGLYDFFINSDAVLSL